MPCESAPLRSLPAPPGTRASISVIKTRASARLLLTVCNYSRVREQRWACVRYGRFVLGHEFPEVLRRAALGDGAAFATLWRDTHPPLLRYLWVAAGDAAEDLASEVWLEVARRIDRFRGGEPEFRGWLFTLARRKLIDRHRYEARRPETPIADTAPLDRPATDDTVAAALEDISTEAALALIATLPRDQAEIVVLRVVVGLDAPQVARVVGKSPGAVRIAAHRGLRTFSARLRDVGSSPTRRSSDLLLTPRFLRLGAGINQ